MDLDRKTFDPGFVNCVAHSLTGVQVLYYLSLTWASDSSLPVILWCRPGDAASKANAVRVSLAKERKARNMPRTFELRFSEPWPYTHMGIKGEAIKITQVDGSLNTQVRKALAAIRGI